MIERKIPVLNILLVLALLVPAFAVLPAIPAIAAALTDVTNAPVPASAGATATHTCNFTTSSALPSNARITITFPSGFNLAGATLGDIDPGPAGTFTLSRSGQTLHIDRDGVSAEYAPGVVTIPLLGIVNTSTSGTTYRVTVQTSSGGTILDGPTDSDTFAITAGASFSPVTGPINTTITVNGTGWSGNELITAVTIDGQSASHTLTVASGILQGTIIVPSGVSGAADIVITGATSGAQTFANAFTQTTAMSTFTPTAGPIGTVCSITVGTGWAPSDTISSVTVGGTAVTAHTLTVSPTGVLMGSFTIPAGLFPGVKTVVITGAISGQQTSGTNFTVGAGATFSPTSGPVATVITVTGTGWSASESISGVTVGGTAATYSLTVSSGALSGTITVPTTLAPGAKNIVITGATSGAQTFANAFTVTASAVFVPTSGPYGTVITVSGTGWAASETITDVTVGGTAATHDLTVNGSGVLSGTITVPAGLGGPVNIVITGSESGAQTFTAAFNVTVTINLNAGWNLISLPLTPTNSSILSVIPSNVRDLMRNGGSVAYLQYTSSTTAPGWVWWTPDRGSTMTTMDACKAYWINVSEACSFTVTGTPCPVRAATAPPVPLSCPVTYSTGYTLGWNMVGFRSTNAVKASTYFQDLTYTSLWKWDNATSKWVQVGADDNLTPGEGYYLRANASGFVLPTCD